MNKNIILSSLFFVTQSIGASWWCCGDSQAVKPYVPVDQVEQYDEAAQNSDESSDTSNTSYKIISNEVARMLNQIALNQRVDSNEEVVPSAVAHFAPNTIIRERSNNSQMSLPQRPLQLPLQLPISMHDQNTQQDLKKSESDVANYNIAANNGSVSGVTVSISGESNSGESTRAVLDLAGIGRDPVVIQNFALASQTLRSFSGLNSAAGNQHVVIVDDASPLGSVRECPSFNVPIQNHSSDLFVNERMYAQPKNRN
ncbi:MAG: hypothetical protein WC747_03720 [Candidatus Babeliales bacterium]|jgi:hypothetical protein